MTERVLYTECDSPIGRLRIVSDGEAVTGVWMEATRPAQRAARVNGRGVDATRDDVVRVLAEAKAQLAAYFAGELQVFDFPRRPAGTTFQRAVWDGLLAIPYGATESYGRLAERIGRPGSARAVGAANGRNPIAIVIPCHRVIGADRSLTGYGGGMQRKQWLLEHEAAVAGARLGLVAR